MTGAVPLVKMPYTFATAERLTETGWTLLATLSCRGDDALSEPEAPVIVTAAVVGEALDAAVSVSVAFPPLTADKAAVTPLGKPLTPSDTVPVNPPVASTVIGITVDVPGETVEA